jgi:hypothetical protein
VKNAARIRLLSLVDPALGVLAHALDQKDKQLPAALAAAKDVLDRAGFKEADKLQLTGADGGPVSQSIQITFVKPKE